jgi:hypothetical protein
MNGVQGRRNDIASSGIGTGNRGACDKRLTGCFAVDLVFFRVGGYVRVLGRMRVRIRRIFYLFYFRHYAPQIVVNARRKEALDKSKSNFTAPVRKWNGVQGRRKKRIDSILQNRDAAARVHSRAFCSAYLHITVILGKINYFKLPFYVKVTHVSEFSQWSPE